MRNDYQRGYNLFIQYPLRPNETSDEVHAKKGAIFQAPQYRFKLERLF